MGLLINQSWLKCILGCSNSFSSLRTDNPEARGDFGSKFGFKRIGILRINALGLGVHKVFQGVWVRISNGDTHQKHGNMAGGERERAREGGRERGREGERARARGREGERREREREVEGDYAPKMEDGSPYEFKLLSLWPQALHRGFHFSQANSEMKSRPKIL